MLLIKSINKKAKNATIIEGNFLSRKKFSNKNNKKNGTKISYHIKLDVRGNLIMENLMRFQAVSNLNTKKARREIIYNFRKFVPKENKLL